MKAKEISLFLNPVAGRGKARQLAQSINAEFNAHGIRVKAIASQAEGEIEDRIMRAAYGGAKSVVVAGGDGSVHEAVNGVLRAGTDTALGVVPIGTGNDFAKALYGSRDWRAVVRSIASTIKNDAPIRTVDVGVMNERYFANGAGIGFDAKVNKIAKKYHWPIGDLVYLVAVFEGLWDGVVTPEVSIQSSDFKHAGAITLANISNGPWIGGLFHIAPMAKIDDGLFDLIIANPMSRARLFSLIPRLLRGSHIGKPGVQHLRIERFSMSSPAALPSHLDGEVQPLQSEFNVHILKGALRIL